jgi:4-carboxymuconolactone decarboxylase
MMENRAITAASRQSHCPIQENTMPPKLRARKNHDDLFPGHVSTLAVSDPELIEVFDNFAFDDLLNHGNLDRRTRL